jgi:hypothetical protein
VSYPAQTSPISIVGLIADLITGIQNIAFCQKYGISSKEPTTNF